MSAPRMMGKVAVVTGGGCVDEGPDRGVGNGRATCIRLAQEGAAVVVADRDLVSARHTVDAIADEGGRAVAIEADVTDADACQAMTRLAVDSYGGLDVLVNNVGIPGEASTVVDVEDWDHVLNVNLKGVMLASKYAVPAMLERGGGSIVHVASIAAFRLTDRIAYTASKGGVLGMTMGMAGQHARDGIRVNCVAPGQVWNPNVGATFGDDPDALAALRTRRRLSSLMKTEGSGWDIANAILFFASDESKFVTGQTLLVDGGLHIGRPSSSE
jgi:NAD(P)-dependent dehydrogenase (short-subunit alcohol dehydrogenase family)